MKIVTETKTRTVFWLKVENNNKKQQQQKTKKQTKLMNIRCNKNLLTVTNGYTKKQTKLMNIRCNKNLLTVTNGYSRTVKKSWKNAVLAKYAANH